MYSISVLVPTLNAGRVLDTCLESIAAQAYPRDLVEIIIADGGSSDDTLAIARRYTDRIYPNPLKTGEAGKAVALKHACGDLVAFVDSDNVLPHSDWLARMVEPFADPGIVGAEPLEYTWRAGDGYLTRYGALMGMSDPLCLFLGNYDRLNAITGMWTAMPVKVQDRGGYLDVALDEKHLPTIGANGFIVRRAALANCSVDEYVFDIDVVYELLRQGRCRFAKVKIGIVHLFSGNARTFVRKQLRRVTDFSYYSHADRRKYPWKSLDRTRLAKFILYCLLVFPLLGQTLIGWSKRRDPAWFFHPVACWITFVVYTYGTLRSFIISRPQDRSTWSQ